jgi:hypothetical protein
LISSLLLSPEDLPIDSALSDSQESSMFLGVIIEIIAPYFQSLISLFTYAILEILLGESFASICLTRSSNKELVVDGYD